MRDVGRKTSRVTHRSLSPKSGAGSTRAVLGRRRFSRVSPPRGGEAPDREATAAEMFTGVALCHEVSGGSQSLAGEDTTSEQSGAGAAQNRRWLPRLQPANDKVSAAIRAIGVLNNEKGAGKFDMLASNASFSDSDGSSSEINVCDFLEEASCSDVKSASEDTGCGIPLGGGGGVGHLAKAYLRGAGSDHNDEENPQGLHMGTLDEQEIAFLAESRELREALLGVEDLSFGKTEERLVRCAGAAYLGKYKTNGLHKGFVTSPLAMIPFGLGQPTPSLYNARRLGYSQHALFLMPVELGKPKLSPFDLR